MVCRILPRASGPEPRRTPVRDPEKGNRFLEKDHAHCKEKATSKFIIAVGNQNGLRRLAQCEAAHEARPTSRHFSDVSVLRASDATDRVAAARTMRNRRCRKL